jgi:putative addiction module killer protein
MGTQAQGPNGQGPYNGASLAACQWVHRDVASVGEGVSELRVHFGPGYRIYFQKRGDEIVLLLCGGDKGTQDRDIVTAKRLAKDWNDEHD